MIKFNYQESKLNNNLLRNKDFLSGVAIVFSSVILLLLIYFLALPLFHSVQATRKAIAENQLLQKNLKEKEATFKQLEKISLQMASKSASLNEALPNYSDTPLTMSLLEKLASEIVEAQGPLLIESIDVSALPNDLPTTTFSLNEKESEIQINFISDYQAVKDFITQLKLLKHNFSVDEISLSAPKSTNLNQLLTVSVKLRYYYFNEN